MRDQWRTGVFYPGMLVELSEKDNARLGNVWMKGRVRNGDLAIVVEHAGDCFWTMQLVRHDSVNINGDRMYQVIEGAIFGAYVCGTPHPVQPTAKEMHLLLGGLMVPVKGGAQ